MFRLEEQALRSDLGDTMYREQERQAGGMSLGEA